MGNCGFQRPWLVCVYERARAVSRICGVGYLERRRFHCILWVVEVQGEAPTTAQYLFISRHLGQKGCDVVLASMDHVFSG